MWSPQHYIENGKKLGRSASILDNAVDQIERVILHNPFPPSLLTLGHLAKRTEVPYSSLRKFITRAEAGYRHFPIRKRAGGVRMISIPEPHLLKVQQWLAKYVLSVIPVHYNSHAFASGCSIVSCAAKHCGAKWLIKLDVTGFFSSISELQVYRVFRSLNYQPLISFELARLCTHAPANSPRYQLKNWQNWHRDGIDIYSHRGQGFLPQGAPTSPMLSNLAMRELDESFTRLAATYRMTYTRYSDDLTFSTRSKDFSRSSAALLINRTKDLLMANGLRMNGGKTTVVPPGARKIVLGLLVDGVQPRLTSTFKDKLRMHLHFLQKDPIQHARARNFDTIWGMRRHIRGLIDYSSMIEKDFGEKSLAAFTAVDWP